MVFAEESWDLFSLSVGKQPRFSEKLYLKKCILVFNRVAYLSGKSHYIDHLRHLWNIYPEVDMLLSNKRFIRHCVAYTPSQLKFVHFIFQ